MADKKTAVFGIYSTRNGAEQAAEALVNGGFAAGDISVLLPENLGTREIGTEKATKAPEGATTGAGTGALLGGALESALWLFPASVHSSPRDPSWPLWRAWESAAQLAV
jgi:hypothetical protein